MRSLVNQWLLPLVMTMAVHLGLLWQLHATLWPAPAPAAAAPVWLELSATNTAAPTHSTAKPAPATTQTSTTAVAQPSSPQSTVSADSAATPASAATNTVTQVSTAAVAKPSAERKPVPDTAKAAPAAATDSAVKSASTNNSAAATSPPRYQGPDLHNPNPRYPYVARQRGWQGRVVLRVEVSAHGQALKVSIATSSGYELLDQAAQETVQNWRFLPAQRAGLAVGGLIEVPINFRLN